MQCSSPELENVLYLDLKMDLGSLHCGAQSESRFEQINSWFRKDPWLSDILFRVRDMRKSGKDVKALKKKVANGEKIRIWYDQMPESICGMYYLVSELYWELYYSDEDLSVVCLNDDPVIPVNCRGLGSLDPNEFADLLKYERKLSQEDRCVILRKWAELKKEQWPMRTCLNGKITGVPVDFYDPIIKACIPSEGDLLPMDILANVLKIYAIPDFSLAEWRLSTILHEMKLKRKQVGPEKIDKRKPKLYRYVFTR